ncbi:helix-turn-helix domain-containing protein [Aestuariicoccus sp. MJ-SS9]|uniref:helix-turn-helix domain-containing protein n=1 Tax=Aestuariicoccus sp. MJ-SS9 TaxID=3079855 RepID=UPI00290AF9A1|nr:helix-turn-helix domain-containing protein [Aestuariicoccus sp. MJ-SS9]MDU8913609.1 helix-turn-helix domain-containing protein [Aestuariicoccus sp. MJ-SS9]
MTAPRKPVFEPLLTIQDVAGVLKCSAKTVQRRIETGDLPVVRDGRMIRVHPADLDRYIRQRRGM